LPVFVVVVFYKGDLRGAELNGFCVRAFGKEPVVEAAFFCLLNQGFCVGFNIIFRSFITVGPKLVNSADFVYPYIYRNVEAGFVAAFVVNSCPSIKPG